MVRYNKILFKCGTVVDNIEKYPELLPVFQDLQRIIKPAEYELWLRPLDFVYENNTFTIIVPAQTWQDTITKRYEGILRDIFLQRLGITVAIQYTIQPQEEHKPILTDKDVISATQNTDFSVETHTPVEEPTQRMLFISRLNASFTFENFIESTSNRFAYKAAEAVVHQLGHPENNPLFIFSSPGLGKTHLLHAIGNQIMKENATAKVLYMSGEEFVNDYIESLKTQSAENFRRKCRSVDCFLMDDIQFVSGKEGCTLEFFNTFNTLYASGKQIVLSSDRSPQQLGWDERLSSRLLSGLTTEIKRPNLETRIAILRYKRDINHFNISDDVISFIAEGVQTNVRELQGCLFRLVHHCNVWNVTATIPVAKEILSDMLENNTPNVNINTIKKIVGKYYSIKMEDFNSKSKIQSIAWPRQIAMYLGTELTDLSLIELGREFNRDHSTVVHARDLVEEKVTNDPFFASQITQIIEDIKDVEKK